MGWTIEGAWEIGAAKAGAKPTSGSADPAEDTSPSADNGVAGIKLGGDPRSLPNKDSTRFGLPLL